MADLTTINSLSTSGSDYSKQIIDDSKWEDEKGTGQSGKITGFLAPPEDGDYKLFVKGFDDAKLFISSTDNPSQRVLICSYLTQIILLIFLELILFTRIMNSQDRS